MGMMTVREVAELLKLSEETVRRMCRDGRLPSVKVNRFLRVRRVDVARLLGEVL